MHALIKGSEVADLETEENVTDSETERPPNAAEVISAGTGLATTVTTILLAVGAVAGFGYVIRLIKRGPRNSGGLIPMNNNNGTVNDDHTLPVVVIPSAKNSGHTVNKNDNGTVNKNDDGTVKKNDNGTVNKNNDGAANKNDDGTANILHAVIIPRNSDGTVDSDGIVYFVPSAMVRGKEDGSANTHPGPIGAMVAKKEDGTVNVNIPRKDDDVLPGAIGAMIPDSLENILPGAIGDMIPKKEDINGLVNSLPGVIGAIIPDSILPGAVGEMIPKKDDVTVSVLPSATEHQ